MTVRATRYFVTSIEESHNYNLGTVKFIRRGRAMSSNLATALKQASEFRKRGDSSDVTIYDQKLNRIIRSWRYVPTMSGDSSYWKSFGYMPNWHQEGMKNFVIVK